MSSAPASPAAASAAASAAADVSGLASPAVAVVGAGGEDEVEDEDENELDDAIALIPALPARATGTMTALAALSPARNPTTRPGRNTRLNRDANIEANLAQITGQVNVPECAHCARRNGVFSLCVSAPGQLSGSCANCHYNNEGVRCSLRPVATAASVAAAVAAAAAADPNLPPPTPASVPALARSARPQRRIQPTLVSGPGVVAPPPSGPSGGAFGRASGRASGVSGRGSVVSGRGSGASGRGVSGRGSAVSGRGSGVPGRGAVPTRAPGWRGARVRTGSVRVPRRSRVERLRAIADAHQTLAELYGEEADRMEEEDEIE